MPTAEIGTGRLHYQVSGNEHGAVLVLANSLGSNLHMWDKVLPAFERNHRVLRFDMRGHGETEAALEPLTIEQLGSDVLRLLDDLRVEKANVCGVSLGGLITLWVGIHAPDRVDRLILANTAARIGSRDLWDQRIATVQSEGLSSLATATVGRWFTAAYRTQHPEEMERIREMIASTDPTGYAACCGVLRDADLRSEIKNIQAESLVITGTHDPATPPADGRALHVAIRNSKYLELNASHMSAWECAEEFAGAVIRHISAGEEKNG